MNNLEAFEAMKQGEKVTAHRWSKQKYIYLNKYNIILDDNNLVWSQLFTPLFCRSEFKSYYEEFHLEVNKWYMTRDGLDIIKIDSFEPDYNNCVFSSGEKSYRSNGKIYSLYKENDKDLVKEITINE